MTPSIIKTINDPDLFRSYLSGSEDGSLDSWKNWMAFLKVLYGLRLTKAEQTIANRCTGRTKFSPDGYQECLLLCGRRSGKSKIIGLVGAFEAILSGKEKGLSAGEIPMTAILSPTRFQSRIIHPYMRSVFDSSPILQGEIAEEKREGFKLKNGVEVCVIAGDPKLCRGFSLSNACLVDEIAMHGLSEESHVKSDTELIRALRPSLLSSSTQGRLLCIGTPFKASG